LSAGIEIPVRQGRSGTNVDGLTRREIDVLEAIRKGWTNREIAASLGIAMSTVKRHVEHILEKLDARNRAQAVALLRDSHRAVVPIRGITRADRSP
jgi:DNA-binding NarL/FixJ family response regulator